MTHRLSDLLGQRAAETPQAVALELEERSVSYGELAAWVAQLAGTLRQSGIGRGDRVGIHAPKGLLAYAGIFATLRAGAAYVPLDPQAPPARTARILDDAAPRALFADRFPETAPAPEGLELIILDGAPPAGDCAGRRVLGWDEALREGLSAPVELPAAGDDPAYVLYTSGSTGQPKGVVHSHRSALAFIDWAVEALTIRPDDRVAGVAGLHFDLSTFDLFATMAAGATLVPLPEGVLWRPREASRWISRQRITTWYSTPSTLVLLLTRGGLAEAAPDALRRVLFAGEVFPIKHLRRLREAIPPETALFNLYGPTETNVCTWHPVSALPGEGEDLPIGRPCSGDEVLVLDAEGRPVPEGEEGELWVQGPSVMLGYRGAPELTRRVLRQRSGAPEGEESWYTTGDLGRRDGRGDLHFHSRRDHMVKVRGYRVELGEVEVALYSHPDIREAAVVAVPDEDQGVRLRACVVTEEPARCSVLEIKRHLGGLLPSYMLPAEIILLDTLPTTPSGKVDRASLARAEVQEAT
ncbi:MAG TPA: amino acid adenylation domain-containing protein [Thermoanaerobaculia bacterium]|nr:amino acid adenylation domain-containing protein [Thermoanaerobaculia bacterium]